MKKLVIATKNQGKVKEIINAFTDLGIEILSLKDFEPVPEAVEDGNSFAENALIKAKFYAKVTGLPCLADDSGLAVEVLNGAPGIYSARYSGENATDEENNAKLIAELQKLGLTEAKGEYLCALALYDISNGKVLTTEGNCPGYIHMEAKGENGFGYDPYFYVTEYNKTMAEITLAEKDKISHRGKALKSMHGLLEEYLK